MRIADALATAVACIGPLGKIPKAPGTVGSAVAVLAAPWLFLPLPLWARGTLLTALFLAGALAAGHMEKMTGQTDPSCVIMDEVVGQWLTFLPFSHSVPGRLLAGFFLFRLFDILKPWPVRNSERWFPGGFGVMADDVLAGIYAAGCLWMLGRALPA